MTGWLDSRTGAKAARSQSAFVRGFIDDETGRRIKNNTFVSQSAFVRGFIDDGGLDLIVLVPRIRSQSAFVRGFIDDDSDDARPLYEFAWSQSAFVRGFIDDKSPELAAAFSAASLNPRSCAASSMTVCRRDKGERL